MPTLEEGIKSLPTALKAELSRALDELERKHTNKTSLPVRRSWSGALSDLKADLTSLELQKEAVDLWAESD